MHNICMGKVARHTLFQQAAIWQFKQYGKLSKAVSRDTQVPTTQKKQNPLVGFNPSQ